MNTNGMRLGGTTLRIPVEAPSKAAPSRRHVTNMWDAGHGYWMAQVTDMQVLASRILDEEGAGGGLTDLCRVTWFWALDMVKPSLIKRGGSTCRASED